jgi:hypothetical protein
MWHDMHDDTGYEQTILQSSTQHLLLELFPDRLVEIVETTISYRPEDLS